MQRFESRDRQFYSHVGHHMEDIRLFSIPPSQRQLDDCLNNSSDTESPEELGELARVEEKASPSPAPGILERYIIRNRQPDNARFLEDWLTSAGGTPVPEDWRAEPEQYITTNHQPDNARFLEDWFTSARVTPVPGVLGVEPIRHKYVKSPINIGNVG